MGARSLLVGLHRGPTKVGTHSFPRPGVVRPCSRLDGGRDVVDAVDHAVKISGGSIGEVIGFTRNCAANHLLGASVNVVQVVSVTKRSACHCNMLPWCQL